MASSQSQSENELEKITNPHEQSVILNRASYALLVGHQVDDDEWKMACDYGSGCFGTEPGSRYDGFESQALDDPEFDEWHLPLSKSFDGSELWCFMAANKRFLTADLWKALYKIEIAKFSDPHSHRFTYEQNTDLVQEAIYQNPIPTRAMGVKLRNFSCI